MGKRLIQQRRGTGSPTYRAPSFRYAGEVKHNSEAAMGRVTDIIHSAGHSAPLLEVQFVGGERGLAFAVQGMKVGDEMMVGGTEVRDGNVLCLKDIPEGTLVHNIELNPG